MKKVKVKFKVKKLFSCLMALLLVMLSCDNGLGIYAAEPEAYALGDEFTEGILKYKIIDEDNKYVEVAKQNLKIYETLEIPAEVTHDGVTYSVTRIGDDAFKGNSLIVVNIPEGVTEIGKNAFRESSVSRVNLPDSVTKIGSYCFYNSWQLYYINLPDSVTEIEEGAFYKCTNLSEIEIPKKIEKIGKYVFRECYELTSIVIPEGVKEIGEAAFEDCRNVETIILPKSLEKIGVNAFAGCGNRAERLTVTIPEGVKEIGVMAFWDCRKLKEITIPLSVEKMGSHVFYECEGLEEVVIEGRISSINMFTFNGCKSLKYIKIPNSVTAIYSSAFKECSALESITMPESVIRIADPEAFNDCTSLREMRIVVDEKKDDITPIAIGYSNVINKGDIFGNVPADRKLVFINSDGTKELAGTRLVAAQTAYKAEDDGDTTDNYWYGWEIGTIADLHTVTIDVKKDGEQWKGHGKKFLLKNKNGYLIDDFQAESGTYTVCVAVGTDIIDTGVTVEVNDSDTSVTIEYFTVTFYDDIAYENDTIWGQQIVRKDDYAIKPGSDPEKADFKFAGWKTDKKGSEAFDFKAGITDTTSIYTSWSEDSEDSTEPTRPSETEKPTEPTKPSETEKPTSPSKPTDTENPTAPSEPSGTENPTEPTKPSGTENPTEPSKPSGTQNPTDSKNPADTETTITPNNPAGSETPSTPSPSPNPNGSPELEEPEGSAPVGEAENGEKPATGDTSHVEIYATAAMIAGLSYIMLMFAKRKNGMTEEEKNIHVSALIEWSKKGSRVRKYVALTAIFFLLLYYHSIGKQLDLQWNEICGN